MEYSRIPGNSWYEYRDILNNSFENWNWESYKISLPYYGDDLTSSQKRRANEIALDEIWELYTEYYISKRGLTYSNRDALEIEQEAFEDYKLWYDALIRKENVSAISPAKTLMLLKHDIELYNNNIEPEIVDTEIVKDYSLDSIQVDIGCNDYKRYLGDKNDVIDFKSFNNLLAAGMSMWPILEYICYENILYKVDDIKTVDKKLSSKGLIQCTENIPFHNYNIINHICENSIIGLKNSSGDVLNLRLSNKDDYAFIKSWIPYGSGNVSYGIPGSNPYSKNPEVWLSGKIISELSGSSNTKLLRGAGGEKRIKVFDLSQKYENSGPLLFFKKESTENMVIMSERKNNASFFADLSSDISSLSEYVEAMANVGGMVSSHPSVLIIGLFAAAIDLISSWIYTCNIETLNELDISKLKDKEIAFLKKKYDIEKHVKTSSAVSEVAYSEHDAGSLSLAATSVSLDIGNDLAADFMVSRYFSTGSAMSDAARSAALSKGIQGLSLAMSIFDLLPKEDAGETNDMSAAKEKAKVIVNKIKSETDYR